MISRTIGRFIVVAVAATMLFVTTTVPANSSTGNGTIHTVEIRNLEFFPSELAVSPGDTVRWVNRDFVPHTATASDNSWDTGKLDKDESAEIVFDSSMTLRYYCIFHPMMKASIVID